MAVPFTVVGIDHVVPRAADPKALERFYLNALGLRSERRGGGRRRLRCGDFALWCRGVRHRSSTLIGQELSTRVRINWNFRSNSLNSLALPREK